MSNLPKYTEEKRKGNIGESFIQYILSSFCLVHKIDGSQDLGNDFICELTKGEYPTNILFYIQVKYWDREPTDYDMKNKLEYWEGSPIPTYLFWINANSAIPFEIVNNLDPQNKIDQLRYKRYTPISHKNTEDKMKHFKPFSKRDFLRDLIVDYARCQYKRGMATVIKKTDFNEIDKADVPLGDNCLFVNDVIKNEYGTEFIKNSWTNLIATAKSLCACEANNEKYLNLALEHARLAAKMIEFANPDFAGFKKVIKKIEGEILSLLQHS